MGLNLDPDIPAHARPQHLPETRQERTFRGVVADFIGGIDLVGSCVDPFRVRKT